MSDKKAALLEKEGAWVPVVLLPPQPVIDQLKREGKDVPSRRIRALIDTGAESTSISQKELDAIGLISRNVRNMIASSGEKRVSPAFDITLELEYGGKDDFVVFPFEVAALDLDEIGVYALIGRDVLRHFKLTYNGPEGAYKLEFIGSR